MAKPPIVLTDKIVPQHALAYAHAVKQFFDAVTNETLQSYCHEWCDERRLGLPDIEVISIATYSRHYLKFWISFSVKPS